MAGYKANTEKSVAFLWINRHDEKETRKITSFTIFPNRKPNNPKTLVLNLTMVVKDVYSEKFKTLKELKMT